MTERTDTKQALAVALKELILTMPFEKISIRDIVERCGVNRQTFYYHFQDKYELMNWIGEQDALPAFHTGQPASFDNWVQGLERFCMLMQEKKGFYQRALKTVGQNAFPAFLQQLIIRFSLESIYSICEDREIDEEKCQFVVEFCATAFVGKLVVWAEKGMKEDPRPFVRQMKEIVDGSALRSLYGVSLEPNEKA